MNDTCQGLYKHLNKEDQKRCSWKKSYTTSDLKLRPLYNGINYQPSTGEFTGFLNHQQVWIFATFHKDFVVPCGWFARISSPRFRLSPGSMADYDIADDWSNAGPSRTCEKSTSTRTNKSSLWFQPIWKICSSNWIISPGFGVKIIFELPPPRND